MMSIATERVFFEQKRQELCADFDESKPLFVGKLLERAYRLYPDRTALVHGNCSLTYREWYERSERVSRALYERGVRSHDRVLLYAENSIAFYVVYAAIWNLGAVIVPINIFLHDKELLHIIRDAQPRLVVIQEHYKKRFEVFSAHEPSLAAMLVTDEQLSNEEGVGHLAKQDCMAKLTPDELCLLLYTSGTSGEPKGVMLSSKNILTNVLQSYARFSVTGNLTDKERFFCILPLFHAFSQNACLWLPLMLGATVIIVAKIDRKLISEGLAQKPTLFFGFPALYGLLCLMKDAPLDTIKMFVSGADMLPDKIRAGFALLYGRKICSGYGLTEASPVVAVNHENNEQATDVVGYPVVGIQCQIRDAEGNILPACSIGILWIRGDNIMLGYYGSPEQTAKVLHEGWLCTGDLAMLKSDGTLVITGRSKDLIIHKGFNIYPQEIENVLLRHPQVIKAAVVGKPEDLSGQVPIAFVAVRLRDESLVNDLRRLCVENLALYKVPRTIICLDDLPMNATGKIDKKQLLNQQYASH